MDLPSHIGMRKTVVIHGIWPGAIRTDFQQCWLPSLAIRMHGTIEFTEEQISVVQSWIDVLIVLGATQGPSCSGLWPTTTRKLNTSQDTDF